MYTIILLKSVAVRKRQVAILARPSREMSLTVRIDWKHFFSRVRVSDRPSNCFLYAKNTKMYREDRISRNCLLNEQASAPSKRGITPVTATTWAATAAINSGVRLSQNGEKQQVKTATTRVYTFTAWKMWKLNTHSKYLLNIIGHFKITFSVNVFFTWDLYFFPINLPWNMKVMTSFDRSCSIAYVQKLIL